MQPSPPRPAYVANSKSAPTPQCLIAGNRRYFILDSYFVGARNFRHAREGVTALAFTLRRFRSRGRAANLSSRIANARSKKACDRREIAANNDNRARKDCLPRTLADIFRTRHTRYPLQTVSAVEERTEPIGERNRSRDRLMTVRTLAANATSN